MRVGEWRSGLEGGRDNWLEWMFLFFFLGKKRA